MHISGAASAAYHRREIESAEDPESRRAEIEVKLNALASPFRTAEAKDRDIIDPRETRLLLAEFVDEAQDVIKTQLGPTANPYLP
jgi:acetyl-CoA carboxylase carboxyltransferase component